MIKYVVSLGQNALALTDHESLSGHVEFIKTVKKLKKDGLIPQDFKIILGNEIYLVDKEEMNNNIEQGTSNFYHFLLLAKDKKGHEQLRKLSSKAWERMFSYKGMDRVPTFYSDIEDVIGEDKGHLIGSSACLGGYIAQNVLKILTEDCSIEDEKQYKRNIHNFINWCIEIFGKDNFYIELQPSNMEEQIKFNEYIIKIIKAYDLKHIITTDAHYLKKEDREIHKAYLTSDEEDGGSREVDDFYSSTHFFTSEELFNNMNYLNSDIIINGIKNTIEIASKIEEYDLANKQIIPKIKLPEKETWFSDNQLEEICKSYEWTNKMLLSEDIYDNYLISLILEGINNKIIKEDYIETFERINIECKEILQTSIAKEECISSYFVTMYNNINIIWDNANSIVAPGRGSAGGYLINYLIGITQVHSLKQGVEMPHWRFICAERPDYPDIDIDIPSHKRDIVFKHLSNYYESIGGKIVRVCTFGTETAKSTILTACFKKGTLVKTINGDKPIETIKKGDLVYTSNGWEKVLAPTLEKNRTLINIKTRNSSELNIACTPDHEFLTIEKIHKGRVSGTFLRERVVKLYPKLELLHSTDKKYQKLYGYCRDIEPSWTQAKNIGKNHYGLRKIDLSINKIKRIYWNNQLKRNFGIGISTDIEINEEFCELMGIWLAEGSSNGNAITFTINQNETNFKNRIISLMWQVFGLDNYSIFHRNDSLAMNISYSSRQLIEFFRQLFEVDELSNVTQWNKYIPKKLMFVEPILQLQIFKGWFVGDGYARFRSKPYEGKNVAPSEAKGATVSKQLCDDMIFILNRNFINPYIIVEHRENYANTRNMRDCYNIMLYGKKARKLYSMKYNSDLHDALKFELDDYSEMDIPVFWNDNVFLKTKLEQVKNYNDNLIPQDVFCLKVPSGNFTVNNTIVHNCRGLKINNDIGLYLSSLIPVERGKVWSIEECYYGDLKKGRPAIPEFKKIIDEHENLLNVAIGIQGLINKRSSHACFDENTMITTYEGLKKIKNIKIGDKVLTHNNRFKTVVKTMTTQSDDIYLLKAKSAFPVEVTGNHPFYIRERKDIGRKKTFSNPQWKNVSELRVGKDYIGIPINTEAIIPDSNYFNLPFDNKAFWWLIGRYLGDGWTEYYRRNKNYRSQWEEKRTIICCNKNDNIELKEITKYLELVGFKYRFEETRTSYKIHINNEYLYEYLHEFGQYAHGKYLNKDILNLPIYLLKSFLDGYISADGYFNKKNNKYSLKTISKELAIGITQVINKVYKKHVGICILSPKKECIEGREVSSKEKYEICFTIDTKIKEQSFYEDGYIWTKLYKINKLNKNKKMYNLTVIDDNSYTANGMIVHNCGVIIVNDDFTKYNALMRTPSGELVTQFSLEDCEYVGNIKYDLLNTKTCAMIQVTLEMLIENNLLKWQGSLRKTYDKYLHPDVIDKTSLEMWEMLNKGELISAFQFDSPVGEQALKAIKPVNLLEATNANNLMRLMTEEGAEQPLEMYVRYKEDISRWYNDMISFGLSDKEIEIMRKHLLKDYGVCSTQEGMMMLSMDKDIAGFNVVESNILRKGVAKKIGEKYEESHQLLYKKGEEKNTSNVLLDYVWNIQIAMQKGYGFSLLHGIEYTYILIQQLNLIYYYPTIFWNAGVLLVESGALEQEIIDDDDSDEDEENNDIQKKEKTTNYGAIAKAIGYMQQHNVSIALPDVNKADLRFKPDINTNEIIFGLKGIMKINNETSKIIINSRPFNNLQDFYERMVLIKKKVVTRTGKIQNKSLVSEAQTIMLIKSGAFDNIENKPREEILKDFLRQIKPEKEKINSKTIEKVIQVGIVPVELKDEIKIYRFKNYIINNKKVQDETVKSIKWHSLDNGNESHYNYAVDFFNKYFICDMTEDKDYRYDENGIIWIAMGTNRNGSFNAVYREKIEKLNDWLNTEDCLEKYNKILFEEIKNKFMQGTISTWEMESMNFYYHEHELANVDKDKYCIEDFNNLPEEPIVVGESIYKGRTYPKFKLSRITGTVLDRDKNKHSITLLTPTSVVQIKFYSGQFAFYDKQISIIDNINGKNKKTVLEDGWFKRGTKLLITGFRREDQFKPKRYKNSIFPHSIQKIIEIKEDNTLLLQNERTNLNEDER